MLCLHFSLYSRTCDGYITCDSWSGETHALGNKKKSSDKNGI